ncbi:MAG: hypothetical protein R2787_09940 [Saprospiraceae bacterium]|nr:hypothetical protein [Lewinellaceae bacterium]HRW74875.1 hypothetical protein [Saprospiraceae bacterium]
MSMLDKARLVIYRIKEKGLEIFLVNTGDQWEFPEIREASKAATDPANHIELDPVSRTSDGQAEKGLAVEGDWHDIPSLKKLLLEDVDFMKDQVSKMSPELDKGAFFALSEAARKVLPDYDGFIKELKEIIRDRNSTKYM